MHNRIRPSHDVTLYISYATGNRAKLSFSEEANLFGETGSRWRHLGGTGPGRDRAKLDRVPRTGSIEF